MFKHMRIFAVGLLAAMIFAGCGESNSSSGKSSDKSSSSSSGSKKKSKKLDPQKLAEGKKAMEEDRKRGVQFEDDEVDGIVLKKFPQDSNIKNYKIPYGVAKIHYGAFNDCTNLTSVTIPDSVTEIGNSAFWGCKNLTSVTIPDSVTEIGVYAFNGCTNLTSVTIPDSVTEIGSGAFSDCTNLTSVTLPDSIESMPYIAFDNIKAVIAAQNNPNFYFYNRGVLFNKKTKSLLAAPSNLTGNYVIPNNITKIGTDAFGCCEELTSITIPNSVKYIGHAFNGCSALTSITIPDSVTEIGNGAFMGCGNLTSITLSNTLYKKKAGHMVIPEKCKIITR